MEPRPLTYCSMKAVDRNSMNECGATWDLVDWSTSKVCDQSITCLTCTYTSCFQRGHLAGYLHKTYRSPDRAPRQEATCAPGPIRSICRRVHRLTCLWRPAGTDVVLSRNVYCKRLARGPRRSKPRAECVAGPLVRIGLCADHVRDRVLLPVACIEGGLYKGFGPRKRRVFRVAFRLR